MGGADLAGLHRCLIYFLCFCTSLSIGEESEKNIVVISARLYVFESETHTWKERGRGEIRLNDSAKDEGVFQSRLGL